MSISRMMAEQVKQSEDTIGTLGKKTKAKKLLFCPFLSVLLSRLWFCTKAESVYKKHFPLRSFYVCISCPTVTSSTTVQETNEEFKNMTGTIHLGRKLILKYNRRELTDKLLIFLALALFLATVLYILKKRLFPFI